jgi:hypothetical protein
MCSGARPQGAGGGVALHDGPRRRAGTRTARLPHRLGPRRGGLPRRDGERRRLPRTRRAPVSATGHGFASQGEATLGARAAGGLTLQARFQLSPPSANLRRRVVSVGQVVDQGNVVIFYRDGGQIANQRPGNMIPIFRGHGVFNLKAEVMDPTPGHLPIASVDDVKPELAAEGQEPNPITQPKKFSPEEVATRELTDLPCGSWRSHFVRGRGRTGDHHQVEASRDIPLVSTDYLFTGDEAEAHHPRRLRLGVGRDLCQPGAVERSR